MKDADPIGAVGDFDDPQPFQLGRQGNLELGSALTVESHSRAGGLGSEPVPLRPSPLAPADHDRRPARRRAALDRQRHRRQCRPDEEEGDEQAEPVTQGVERRQPDQGGDGEDRHLAKPERADHAALL